MNVICTFQDLLSSAVFRALTPVSMLAPSSIIVLLIDDRE